MPLAIFFIRAYVLATHASASLLHSPLAPRPPASSPLSRPLALFPRRYSPILLPVRSLLSSSPTLPPLVCLPSCSSLTCQLACPPVLHACCGSSLFALLLVCRTSPRLLRCSLFTALIFARMPLFCFSAVIWFPFPL